MILLTVLLSLGVNGPPEQPRLVDYVEEVMGESNGSDTIYDGAIGRVPIPKGPIRRATFVRLMTEGGQETTCELTFDE